MSLMVRRFDLVYDWNTYTRPTVSIDWPMCQTGHSGGCFASVGKHSQLPLLVKNVRLIRAHRRDDSCRCYPTGWPRQTRFCPSGILCLLLLSGSHQSAACLPSYRFPLAARYLSLNFRGYRRCRRLHRLLASNRRRSQAIHFGAKGQLNLLAIN